MASPSWTAGSSEPKASSPSFITQEEPQEARKSPSYMTGLSRAALQGLSFGFSDEIEAFLTKGDKSFKEKVAEIRNDMEVFAQENPMTAFGAEIGGSIPTALLGGAGLARLGVKGAAKVAGIEGAAYGLGTGDGDVEERLKSAAIGGTVGAVVGKGSDMIFPKVSEAARELMSKGVRLTPAQRVGGTARVLEEKAASVPLIGDIIADAEATALQDFNRAAMNNALKMLDESKPRANAALSILGKGKKIPKSLSGNQAYEFANEAISDAYEAVIPKLSVTLDDEFEKGLIKIVQESKGLGPEGLAKFQSKLETIFGGVNGNVASGQVLRSIDGDLGFESSNFRRSGSASERDLGFALDKVQRLLRDSLSSNSPSAMKEYQRAQAAFKAILPVRRAVVDATVRGGTFTPAQLARASKATDKSKDKLATAKGQAAQQQFAQQAQEVMGQTIANSGTADRAALMVLLNEASKRPVTTLAGGGLATIGAGALYRNPVGRGLMSTALQTPRFVGTQAAPALGAMSVNPLLEMELMQQGQ